MATTLLLDRRDSMIAETGEFLTTHLQDQQEGWPRLGSRPDSWWYNRALPSRAPFLSALIVGELALDVPVLCQSTKAEAARQMQSVGHRLPVGWIAGEPRVSGFVAQVARVASALGVSVAVYAAVPVNGAAKFRCFLDDLGIDQYGLLAVPGLGTRRFKIECRDGQVIVTRRGGRPPLTTPLPRRICGDWDAVLVDPAAFYEAPGNSIRRLIKRQNGRHSVLGVRVADYWKRKDLCSLQDESVWAFLRKRDASVLASALASSSACEDDDEAAIRLKLACGVPRLVVHLGHRGAILMNGQPRPCRFDTCPLVTDEDVGAGDTLLAVTTLSSAVGADDQTSLRRGVAAATGHTAGLELPTCLEELDDA